MACLRPRNLWRTLSSPTAVIDGANASSSTRSRARSDEEEEEGEYWGTIAVGLSGRIKSVGRCSSGQPHRRRGGFEEEGRKERRKGDK